jgi:hypothetical protein
LPEGRYLISAGAPQQTGMVSRGGVFYPRAFHPNATTESEARVIEVSEGSESANIDIMVSAAKRTRAVSGRVIHAETGMPVEGVYITWAESSDDGKRLGFSGWLGVSSRANGEFYLKGMTPGKYAVLPRANSENRFFGEPVMCDLTERDASGLEIKVREGGSISGVVIIEGTNDPMALRKLRGLSLNLRVVTDYPALQRLGGETVNADGSFRISGLPPCVAQILFYPRLDDRALAFARIERDGAPVSDGINVGEGEHVTGVRVVLTYATHALRGEVKITGAAPPAGLKLRATVRKIDQKNSSLQAAEVDARGQFIIEGLVPGEYEVMVRPFRGEGADPITAHIAKAFSLARERVIVNNGAQRVTLVIDLSGKGGDR